MLATDPLILEHHPDFLASDVEFEEVEKILTEKGLSQRIDELVIGGDRRAALRRFIWQAKQKEKEANIGTNTLDFIQHCFDLRDQHRANTCLNDTENEEFRNFVDAWREKVPYYSLPGVTKDGYPVFYTRWGQADMDWVEQQWKERPEIMKRNQIRLLEYKTQVQCKQETLRQGKTVDRIVFGHDLTNCGTRHLLFFKDFLGSMANVIRVMYPECMGRTCIFNAPWYLVTAGKVLKYFIHPMAQNKILIDSGKPEWLHGQLQPDEIPPFAGGTCKSEFVEPKLINGGLESTYKPSVDGTPAGA